MSRIGKKPIVLPAKVELTVDADNKVEVKGPKGSLTLDMDADITLEVVDQEVLVKRPTEQKRHKALHGLYRSLINNMVTGVNEGYKTQLELVGVGYKATVNGGVLELSLGYSHSIFMALPPDVKATAVTEKGKNPIITLEAIDKQLLGHVSSKIKSLRRVEPYKGKGIRFVGENVRRKAGKTAAK
ncbi:50S ribosomal protein L6 [Cytophagaceae bacterium ABcell3]|nr:50S ribosomal protein L6 [Cytophagaceae bacterium ABcell3]